MNDERTLLATHVNPYLEYIVVVVAKKHAMSYSWFVDVAFYSDGNVYIVTAVTIIFTSSPWKDST